MVCIYSLYNIIYFFQFYIFNKVLLTYPHIVNPLHRLFNRINQHGKVLFSSRLVLFNPLHRFKSHHKYLFPTSRLPVSGSNTVSEDDMCMNALDEFENSGLDDEQGETYFSIIDENKILEKKNIFI